LRGSCGGIVWWRKRRKKRFNTEDAEEEHREHGEFEEHSPFDFSQGKQEWLCHNEGGVKPPLHEDGRGLVERGMGK
jgi:hypothetical protein